MAILQIEIAREALGNGDAAFIDKDRDVRLRSLLYDALRDTLRNGGTFTVVAGPTHITAVQMSEAVDLDGGAS